MNIQPNTITRRQALLSAFQGTVAVLFALPLIAKTAEASSTPESDFVPENDYPFFGPEPDSHQ